MNDAPDATKPTDDPLCTLCITLPASLRERLKAEADANQRSESGQIRYLLIQRLGEAPELEAPARSLLSVAEVAAEVAAELSLSERTVRRLIASPLCTLCITLPASLRERLKAEADANQRSESGQIRYLLTQHLVERDDSNEAA